MTSSPAYIVFAAWNDFLHIQAMLNNQANVAGVSCIVSQGVPYWSFEPGCTNGFCGQTIPQGPGVTIASPADSATVSGQVTLQGTTAGNGVTAVAVQVDGGPFVAATGIAAWTLPAEHRHTFQRRPHHRCPRDGFHRKNHHRLPPVDGQPTAPRRRLTPTLDTEEWAFLPLINNYRAQNGAGAAAGFRQPHQRRQMDEPGHGHQELHQPYRQHRPLHRPAPRRFRVRLHALGREPRRRLRHRSGRLHRLADGLRPRCDAASARMRIA